MKKPVKSVFIIHPILFLLVLLCCGIWGNQTLAAETEKPSPVKLRMINESEIEIYWNQEVTGADNKDNFTVRVNGVKRALRPYGWYSQSAVYFDRMTTIALQNPVVMNQIPIVTIELGSGILNAAAQPVDTTRSYEVDFEPYYTQYLTCDNGITIKSSDGVSVPALEKAKAMIDFMLSKRADVSQKMVVNEASLALYGKNETAYHIPEHREWYDEQLRYVEGYGGSMYNPVSTVTESNVLRLLTGDYVTLYRDESILVHEFGHAVKSIGIDQLEDQSLSREFQAAYKNAKESGLWPDSYAISNDDEFFATVSAIWFNVMNESWDGGWDSVRGPVNTRDELYVYDRKTYEFFAKIYPFEGSLPSPWDSVPNNHDIAQGVKAVDLNYPDVPEKPKVIDKTTLTSWIQTGQSKNSEEYTQESWNIFEEELNYAIEIEAKADASQEEVDAAIERLTDAIEGLVTAQRQPDKSALFTAIREADEKIESDYTAASWTEFTRALEAARVIAVKEDAAQGEVDSTLSILEDAIKELVKYSAPADKTALNAAIQSAESKIESDYTPASWIEFTQTLEAARAIAEEEAGQNDVDSMAAALEDAIKMLEKVPLPVDKTALNAAIQSAEEKKESEYTKTSWAEFTQALEAAKVIAVKEDADQGEVDSTLSILEDAIKELVKYTAPVDKTALNAAIQSAESKIESDYTPASWIEFMQTLEAARAIAEEEEAVQNDVDSMAAALEDAIKELVKYSAPADKTALNAAIQSAESKIESDYTPSSWIEFTQTLEAARAIAEEEADQNDVDSMAAALEDAIKMLEEVPLPVDDVDKTALNAAIQSAESKIESDYTPASWIEFTRTLEAARAIAGEEEAAQNEVDSMSAALEDAIKALEKVPLPVEDVDKTALNAAIQNAEGKKQSNYTKDSWNLLTAALKEAKAIAAKSTATQSEATAAANKLEQATKTLIAIKVISRKTVTLGRKETFKTYVSGKRKDCYFVSSNDKVAKVSSKGIVTAIKKGKATITAVNKNGNAVTLKITVKKSPSKILKLNAVEKTLKKNQTFKIKYKLPNNTASHKITYKSSNRTVATVNKKGKVTAKKKGKTTISVETYNGKIKKLKIIVN